MAFKNLNIADRLKGLKVNGKDISQDDFITMLNDEDEHEIEITQGSFMTDEDLTALKERVGKDSATKGARTILEMEIKKKRDELGLEFEGKTIENLLEAHAKKVKEEMKLPANEKVNELTQSLEKLRKQYEVDTTEKQSIIESLNKKIQTENITNRLLEVIPKDLKGLNTKQALTLLKSEYEFDIEENNIIVKKDGQILKDKFEKPLTHNDIVNEYVVKNGWLNPDGRGDGNQAGATGAFKSVNEAMLHMMKNNIAPDSDEGLAILNKVEGK